MRPFCELNVRDTDGGRRFRLLKWRYGQSRPSDCRDRQPGGVPFPGSERGLVDTIVLFVIFGFLRDDQFSTLELGRAFTRWCHNPLFEEEGPEKIVLCVSCGCKRGNQFSTLSLWRASTRWCPPQGFWQGFSGRFHLQTRPQLTINYGTI